MTLSIRRTCVVTAAGLAVLTGSMAAPAGAQDRVSEPFQGVRHIQQVLNAPRPVFVNVLEVDLAAPGVSFRLTPEVDGLANGDETVTQTTRDFVEEQNAQLGINAHFFRLEHHSQNRSTNNIGIAASDGNVYSPWDNHMPAAFNIGADNVVTPLRSGSGTNVNPNVALYNAFAGNFRLISNGDPITQAELPRSENSAHNTYFHPRTAVGLTDDNKLLLVTVDGRQPVFSEGVYIDELASIMKDFGAVEAINLDGGGSTTMVADFYGDKAADGGDRRGLLLSSPTGRGPVGSERNNGTNLAVFAAAPTSGFTAPHERAVPAGLTVLADFETDEGTFASEATSGSNRNIARARFERIGNDGYFGEHAQRLALDAEDANAPTILRHLSGGGSPPNNTAFDSTGHVGFFVKIVSPGHEEGEVQLGINLDDGSAHEQGELRNIPADGGWHLVEWDLDDESLWSSFAGGNGVIDAEQVTVDSIYLSSPEGGDVTIYWDGLLHNPSGSISSAIPEPGAALSLIPGLVLAARRIR